MALRAIREGTSDPKCDSEPNFPELYSLLGDREQQEAIRQDNPDVPHCNLLLHSPTACHSCPKNPLYKKEDAEQFNAFIEHSELLEQSQLLHDMQELGLGKADLSPEEFEVLRLMRQHELLISARIQGNEVAKIIAQIFSKK